MGGFSIEKPHIHRGIERPYLSFKSPAVVLSIMQITDKQTNMSLSHYVFLHSMNKNPLLRAPPLAGYRVSHPNTEAL